MEEFLTIGYCSRATEYCFDSPLFLEIWGGGTKAMMERDKVMTEGTPSLPSRENHYLSFILCTVESHT